MMRSNSDLTQSFEPAQQRKDLKINGIRINGVVSLFERQGFDCEVNAELTGMSGARHSFDIVARRDSEIVVVDIVSFRASILDTPASDDEVAEQISIAALRMRVKGWDCGAYQRIIIHLSSHFSDGQRVSEHDPFEHFLNEFDIQVIRSADIQDAGRKIEGMLSAVEMT
ncbi:MAG: hypothetical protein M1587_01040 [Thaumarchaeota archaeon]|nr:hypothetical protein [Nitrososphaerota archaeon]